MSEYLRRYIPDASIMYCPNVPHKYEYLATIGTIPIPLFQPIQLVGHIVSIGTTEDLLADAGSFSEDHKVRQVVEDTASCL